MSNALSRSRSLRLRFAAKGNDRQDDAPKQFAKQELLADNVANRLAKGAAQPVSGSTTSAGNAQPSGRPSTAGGAVQRSRDGAAMDPDTNYRGEHAAKLLSPALPAVVWTTEVKSTNTSPFPPRSSSKQSPPHLSTGGHVVATSVETPKSAETVEIMDGRVKRWKSIRGLFGKKSPAAEQARLTPPFGDFSGLQDPWSGPTRPEGYSARAWSDQGKSPRTVQKRVDSPQASQYSPPLKQRINQSLPPLPHERRDRIQDGQKPKGGAAPHPFLDVDVPTAQMERYSVMFNGLIRAHTQPSLLSRRQGNASKVAPLHEESVKLRSDIPHSHFMDGPATPRTQAQYQLSLFPPASPHSGTLNPLRMHQPRKLQRSATSPVPRSPSAVRQTLQGSVSTLSEEVPVRLDLGDRISPHSQASVEPQRVPQLTVQVIEVPSRPTPESMLPTTQTPSTAASSRFSFVSADSPGAEAEAHITGPWKPHVPNEPVWEMVTSPPSSAAISIAYSDSSDRSPSQNTAATAFSEEDIVKPSRQRPQVAHIQVARQLSVTRATSTKRYLEPRVMEIGNRKNERSGDRKQLAPTLVDRKPLTPTLVELRDRKSQRVQIEGF